MLPEAGSRGLFSLASPPPSGLLAGNSVPGAAGSFAANEEPTSHLVTAAIATNPLPYRDFTSTATDPRTLGMGRFMGTDRVSGKPNLPSSWNRYAFDLNNPVKTVDPDGQFAWEAADWISYQQSSKEWVAAFNAFRASPSFSTGLTAVATFAYASIDAAAVILPGVPAIAGHIETGTRLISKLDFAPGKLLSHFEKHGAELGAKNAEEYLRGAQKLAEGGEGVASTVRANGDRLFYKEATNEFTVVNKDGTIRTYFQPKEGVDFWQDQVQKAQRTFVDN